MAVVGSKFTKERIEKAARIYSSNASAGEALGIRAASFGRLCRRYGILTPAQRRKEAAARCGLGR